MEAAESGVIRDPLAEWLGHSEQRIFRRGDDLRDKTKHRKEISKSQCIYIYIQKNVLKKYQKLKKLYLFNRSIKNT